MKQGAFFNELNRYRKNKASEKRIMYYDMLRRNRKKNIYNPNQNVRKYGDEILHSQKFISSGNNIQHGNISVRKHSIQVAKYSLIIADKLGVKVDKKSLVRGALLHDYFLYDWHSKEHVGLKNLHGLKHPGIALQNAKKDYRLSLKEKDIIEKHMWPLTIVPPMCKEAWIVSVADKYCSTMETMGFHKGTNIKENTEKSTRNKDNTMKFIKNLLNME